MQLRGVRVHNLQGIDVTIPWGRLSAISGVSGSGKSSLAFDTLFAEGQRRYLASLSPRARRFLEQMPAPEADHIDPLPPALAVRQNARTFPPRATVGNVTEISHYLRLLFSKAGKILCPACGHPVQKQTPQQVLEEIHRFPAGQKFQMAFPAVVPAESENGETSVAEGLIEKGFTRAVVKHRSINLQTDPLPAGEEDQHLLVIVDRLTAGHTADERMLDSLELAFSAGEGRCVLLRDETATESNAFLLDGKTWRREQYSDRLRCETCGREFAEPEPRLFNPHSPAGACPTCEGTGTLAEFSLEQLVPEPAWRLADGAVACFRVSPLASRSAEWLQRAALAGVPLDVPFSELSTTQKALLIEGDPAHAFSGLRQIFEELQQASKKPAVQAFLNRWLLMVPCPDCQGQRLKPESQAVRVGEANIAEVCNRPLIDFHTWLKAIPENLTETEHRLLGVVLVELESRVGALLELDLGYLSLDRPLSTLAGGESQRVALTRILGNQLVHSLYVLDEPSAGLHPADCERVMRLLEKLKHAENTIVVVEHEEAFLNGADHLIDLGPGAGRDGGRVVFEGVPGEITAHLDSQTGRYLSGAETVGRPFRQTAVREDFALSLRGAKRFPLKDITASFPLNCLCVITGVSGSGKTVLLEQVLYPAVQFTLGQPIPRDIRSGFDDLEGGDPIEDVVLLDQTPLSGSSRSNPVTYLGAFDDIRRVFAESPEANRLGFQMKDFSFNSPSGGRCPNCAGQGTVRVEMQFLADLEMVCPECQGSRYRPEILNVRYRGLHIAEVLDLTVAEAFPFFRTQPRLQKRLQVLKDVGLDYLPLGQRTASLSGGESQRLKLASFLIESSRSRTLFLLDEPTSGLHPADIQTLLNCFDHLLAVGHSVIVAEHNLHLIAQADWIIDLGPGAAEAGGRLLAAGPPEEIAKTPNSPTARCLKNWQSRKKLK